MRLILNPGREGEQELLLPEGVTTIGRTEESSVCVLHKSLSRRHARLEREGSRVVLVDQGSKNGTFVGEQRVERHELDAGQAFRCGEVWFQLLAADPDLDAGLSPLHTRTLDTRFSPAPGELSLDAPRLRVRPEPEADATRERLQVLLAVAQLLSSPGSLDSLLERILQLVFRVLGVDRAALLLVDEATGELRPRVARAATGEVLSERFHSQHIVDSVRKHGLAALFANAQQDVRLDSSVSIRAQSIHSAMCVPLKSRDTWLGVLYVDNRSHGGLFTEADLEFLTAFAHQAAVALDNARLTRRLEEEAVLRNTYLRFFPPAVVRRLHASPGTALEVVETEVTVLFADISDFTPLSSSRGPRDVVDMLNAYFPVMADVVFRHEGTLEKYIGDALMAVWGAPFSREDDADRAVRAAVDMQRELAGLNARFRARGQPELRIHVGLNSGPAAAGNIGSEHYLQYATLGDVTNVASRVCGVAKAGQVVLSEATRVRLRESRWPLTTLPPTHVKGKQEALTLHRVEWDVAGG
ncbi:GAF domain-containing protein [Myxococcus sp. MISCRS1]|jgi:adenylate cyclase|uniref:adenylate/guanylate cyclase domain-containing protein n=1 Tax=Myxococcus TaxID=32 RepID=UPI001CC044B4|nr:MULTISPECIES: adenylate/guanylate cyclase domain-containing protein [unclassified Myxococcus]MBZ4400791.1 GAF domain-containing protein [Myxococcus sp. AS-1-15]MBZ4413646.1 GAF domain-containing protein [Myxococcus sp. XM-1-1-1]MCY0996880.1 GAF domain-containing protein [Myxococcus sp. MISCRS1]BDT33108.1 GAF domain-containing protein [Myxococcus sp. MH1]